nr:myosin heavy chain, striated muscle isoform X2 [Ipomoea batatas]
MASFKWLFFTLHLLLIFTEIASDGLLDPGNDRNSHAVSGSEVASDPSLLLELDQLKSKISLLESSISERVDKLRAKDEKVEELEKILASKSAALESLQTQFQLIQEQKSLNAKEQVGKANARADELEKQNDILKKEIEAQNKQKDNLVGRANEAEEKIQELNLKLENLQRINEEQKSRIRKTERALRVAEEEMVKAKMEASSISKQLQEIHEGWLPRWLAVHLVHCQSIIVTHWNEHGRPALNLSMKKALEKKSELETWVKPHIHTFQTEWIPMIKEHCREFARNIEPQLNILSTKTIDFYHASKNYMEPHIVRAQEFLIPYYEDTKKFTEPYIDHIAFIVKPHVDKATAFLKPYSKKAIRHYRKFMKSARLYHQQVQTTIHDKLKNNEYTEPFATKELAWLMASALVSLPVLFLLNMSTALFRKAPKKRSRSHHKSHTHRRAKRVHQEK